MASKLKEIFRNRKDPLKNKIRKYQNCLYKKGSSYFICIIFTSPNISLLLIEYWMVENFFQFKSRNLSWSWIIIRQGMRFEFYSKGRKGGWTTYCPRACLGFLNPSSMWAYWLNLVGNANVLLNMTNGGQWKANARQGKSYQLFQETFLATFAMCVVSQFTPTEPNLTITIGR